MSRADPARRVRVGLGAALHAGGGSSRGPLSSGSFALALDGRGTGTGVIAAAEGFRPSFCVRSRGPSMPVLSYRVEDKMRLSKDKATLAVNPTLTLAGIPPETFQYRLGNRSALEWVIDQYQVSEDKRSGIRSDPNRADDKEYIVKLVGQVVQVSLKTTAIIDQLPTEFM
jgi:hypothetical protein